MRAHVAAVIGVLALGLMLAASGVTLAQAPGAAAPAPAQPPASLYSRLGGYDSLAVLTDDFIARLSRDRSLARFFSGASDESMHRMRQHLLDQLCAASGGPCFYVGRDMKTAHQGLGIGEADWAATVWHLVASLNRMQVGPKEKGEVLAIAAGLKKGIVEKR
jgi:hemoglobin